MEKGKIIHSPLFIARILSGQTDTRIAAVAPQKIFKKAVTRNKVKRIIYLALRSIQGLSTKESLKNGNHILILAKLNALKAPRAEMESDLKAIFVKAGIMR
jgi:ribonuclease P protein component